MSYEVTAPLVIVKDEAGSYHHVYQGAPVPAFVAGDDLDRLAGEGLITEVAGEKKAAVKKAAVKKAAASPDAGDDLDRLVGEGLITEKAAASPDAG